MKNQRKGTQFLAYTGSKIVAAVASFSVIPIFSRVLTPEAYGKLALMASTQAILGAFIGLSLHGAIGIKYFELKKYDLKSYIETAFSILCLSVVACILFTLLFSDLLASATGLPVFWIQIACIGAWFQFLIFARQSLLQAEGKAFEFALWELVQLPISIGLSLYLVIVKQMSWEGRILGTLAGLMVAGLCSIFMLYKDKLFSSLSLNPNHAKHALSFGIPLIPHALFGILAITANQFIANRYLGAKDVGIYSIASQLSLASTVLVDSFVKVFGPWLNKSITNKVNPELIVNRIVTSWLTLVASAMLISLLLFNIFPFLIGGSFAQSRYLIPILCFGAAFTGCYYSVAGLFFYTSKTSLLPVVTISSGIVSILMSFLLVNHFGLYGLAFSLALGQALQFSFALLLSRKAIQLPWIRGIKISLGLAH